MASTAGAERPSNNRDRLIVALDLPDADAALGLVDDLGDEVLWYKVGMELFYAEGPGFVERLRERGKRVFLDLKLHDIPNTMAGALRSVARLGVGLTTVHVPAGDAALRAVAAVADELRRLGSAPPRILGVTRLTSLDAPDPADPLGDVVSLARRAMECGLDGWIAPVEAAARLRREIGPAPVLVCPGVRLPDGDRGDQIAVGTPEEARAGGADWIVVGRPVARAADPRVAAREFVARLG